MASIFLIRHAQASFGTDDYDRLSPLGIQQARIAGEFLGATAGRITRIITGPLQRQRETAATIAAKLREARCAAPEVESDPRLDELRIDEHIARIAPTLADPNGELAADLARAKTSSRAYQKVIRRVFTHWQQLSHDSEPETWPAFAARARGVIRDIAAQSTRGEITVAVSSGALISAITQHVLGLPDSSTYGLFEAMKNCSITHFLHSGERISLSSFNDTTYLAALGASRGATSLITYR
jgi:broad specificity phosphatase PhoE